MISLVMPAIVGLGTFFKKVLTGCIDFHIFPFDRKTYIVI